MNDSLLFTQTVSLGREGLFEIIAKSAGLMIRKAMEIVKQRALTKTNIIVNIPTG